MRMPPLEALVSISLVEERSFSEPGDRVMFLDFGIQVWSKSRKSYSIIPWSRVRDVIVTWTEDAA